VTKAAAAAHYVARPPEGGAACPVDDAGSFRGKGAQ